MIDKLREILEVLQRHPSAPQPKELSTPVVWADAEGDTWRLWMFPQADTTLDAEDRELIWREFNAAISDIIGIHLPDGVQVLVTPPHTFANGQTVKGNIRYTYPPPESEASDTFWWNMLSGSLNAVSSLMSRRLVKQWPGHLAEKEKHANAVLPRGEKAASRIKAQTSAVRAAQERNRKPGQGSGGISM